MKTANQVYAVQAYKPCHQTRTVKLARLEIAQTLEKARALFDSWYANDNEMKPELTLVWLH